MASFLLDTTVLIQASRRYPSAQTWLDEARERRDLLGTSSVNVGEVFSGCQPRDRDVWTRFFSTIPVWAVRAEDGAWAGRTRYDLARGGYQVHLPDSLVAAVAHSRGATLVTANEKDFRRMGLDLVCLPD